jgi:hypothetical protein
MRGNRAAFVCGVMVDIPLRGVIRNGLGTISNVTIGGVAMVEKILAMLEQITDTRALERIYWFVERLLVRQTPKR